MSFVKCPKPSCQSSGGCICPETTTLYCMCGGKIEPVLGEQHISAGGYLAYKNTPFSACQSCGIVYNKKITERGGSDLR